VPDIGGVIGRARIVAGVAVINLTSRMAAH
jgi:hypothetical protein